MGVVRNWMITATKKILKFFFLHIPMTNTIVFESNPDYACNTYPVFLCLREELPNYKMVWCVTEQRKKPRGVDDTFQYEPSNFYQKVKGIYYLYMAKVFVSCNRIMPKVRPEQVSVFLCHGSKTKKTKGLYEVGPGIDYVNVQSHFFDDIITYEYGCQADNLVYLGYPRCDWLFEPEQLVRQKTERLLVHGTDGYVVWLPTFRKHKNSVRVDQMNTEKYGSMGMPLVYTQEDLWTLNEHLIRMGISILYKPHPVQDVSGLKTANLSHIHIITDKDLEDQRIQLYEVLAGSSGLITDYSSVYFDYLLLNRPIATTTDDIEEWKQMTGFAFDLDSFYDRSTTRCPDLETLMEFLSDIHIREDVKKQGREQIRDITNMWNDGNSAKRVATFIKEKIGK